jgi:serine/threonine protein kinase/Flp pilus assembly protein TadD
MRPIEHSNDVSQHDVLPSAVERLVRYEEAKASGNGISIDPWTESADRDELACVDLLHRVWPDPANAPAAKENAPPKTLGDFRILRELGRGGMGVVYEAEQISIGRRVALKVLPFAAMLDPKQLNRFKNEARAAGTLDHPNIVAIHFVGCERSVHFYAMQLIEGRSLADVIQLVRREAVGQGQRPVCGSQGSRAPDSGRPNASRQEPPSSPSDTQPVAALSTLPDLNSSEFYRTVARLGIQAAEALDHAHQNGIVHRDIKPANLLLDNTNRLWITDFGLARIEAEAGVTMSGDLLGTLRYMSPEQALAKRVVVDHRTDIYSLGATLYELLTLRPVFDGEDRQVLIRQISFDEPKPLRRIKPQIPVELETILLKALRKNPADRYASAQDLADDLRCFIEHKPIKARPPSWREQALKWSRRHPAAVRATLVALLAIAGVIGASVGWIVRDRATRRTLLDHQIQQAIDETEAAYQSGKLIEATSAIKRAEGLISSGNVSEELQQRSHTWRADLETVNRLEQIRLNQALPSIAQKSAANDKTEQTAGKPTRTIASAETFTFMSTWDLAGADRAYGCEFQRYGLNLNATDIESPAQRIRASPIRKELVAALEDWYQVRMRLEKLPSNGNSQHTSFPGKAEILQIAELADPDPWRNRLRHAIQHADFAALRKLAKEMSVSLQSPQTGLLLARALMVAKQDVVCEEAESILRELQRLSPGDFWINFELANSLPGEKREEEIGFRRVAVALRPASSGALVALGSRLLANSNYGESEATYREAIRQMPNFAYAHFGLGQVLSKQGKRWEGELAIREAIRLEPGETRFRQDLCALLIEQDRFADCEAAANEAISLEPNSAIYHAFRAFALAKQAEGSDEAAKWEMAASEYVTALELPKGNFAMQMQYRFLFKKLAHWDKIFDRVAQRVPTNPELWLGRAQHYALGSRWTEAAANYAKGIHSRPFSNQAIEYAYLLVLLNDTKGYQRFCQELIDRYPEHEQLRNEWWYGNDAAGATAYACAALPGSAVEPTKIVEWATLDVKTHPNLAAAALHGLGLAQYRAGQYTQAIRTLEESNGLGWRNSGKCQSWLVMAMAHHQLGHDDEARSYWTMTLRVISELFRNKERIVDLDLRADATKIGPRDWICIHVLCREAAALLGKPLPPEIDRSIPIAGNGSSHSRSKE